MAYSDCRINGGLNALVQCFSYFFVPLGQSWFRVLVPGALRDAELTAEFTGNEVAQLTLG
jgi:hypothetical protein